MSTSTVKRRIVRSFSAQGVSSLLTLIDRFATVSLFLSFWGLGVYGEWLVIRSIPAYLSAADMGFASAGGNQLTECNAAGREAEAAAIYQTIWCFTTLSAVCLVAAVTLIVTLLPIRQWLNISVLSVDEFALAASLACVHVGLVFQTQLAYTAARSVGAHDRAIWFTQGIRVAELLLMVGAIAIGAGVVGCVLALVGGRLIGAILLFVWQARLTPWMMIGVRHFDARILVALAPSAVAFTLLPMSTALNLQASLMLVSAFASPMTAAGFATLRTMSRAVLHVGTHFNKTLWPELGLAFSAGDLHLARRLHQSLMRLALLALLAGTVGLYVFAGPILHVWTQGQVTIDAPLLRLFLLGAVLNAVWLASSAVAMARDQHKRITAAYVSLNGLMLVCAYLLFDTAPERGVHGLAIMLAMVEALTLVLVLKSSARLLGLNLGSLFRRSPAPTVSSR